MERIKILMSTFNGEKYLREQIDSILNQNGVDVELLVRDDGSTDGTKTILDEYKGKGQLQWYQGKNLKPAGSFFDLINYVSDDTEYYALSDQDDVWLPDKCVKSIEALKKNGNRKKAKLYCCDTRLVNSELQPIEDQRVKTTLKTVKQAIVGSGAAGCTMCFNRALLLLLRKEHGEVKLMHDNWIYKVCMFTGGEIYQDRSQKILYRQHGGNQIGGLKPLRYSFYRHIIETKQSRCYRSKAICELYRVYYDYLPEENRKIIKQIIEYKKPTNRIRILFDKGYRTGNKKNDLYFLLGILTGLF